MKREEESDEKEAPSGKEGPQKGQGGPESLSCTVVAVVVFIVVVAGSSKIH